MKNRLILFALAIVCYGHMQAADTGEKGWFANQWNKVRYSPYNATSLKRLSAEDAARRVHAMQFLYEPENLSESVGTTCQGYNLGKLSPGQQEAIIVTYPEVFANAMDKSTLKYWRLIDTENALRNVAYNKRRYGSDFYPHTSLEESADYYKQKTSAEVAKQQKLMKMQDDFLKQYEKEAQTASSPNWLQRQRRIQHHPDYFEY